MKNKLKLVGIISSLFSLSLLYSCGDEKDETPEQDQIVGTWNYSSMDYEATINGQDYIIFLSENLGMGETEADILAKGYLESEDIIPSSIVFNADGTYVIQETSSTETGTYSFQDNETQLTLNPDEGDAIVFEVIEFTDNSLTLASSQEGMRDINQDGVEETIVVLFEVSFLK